MPVTSEKLPCIVKHDGEFYLAYKENKGKAHLLTKEGKKYSGTPEMENCELVKEVATRDFNGHSYFRVKQGVFSASSGKQIRQLEIVSMFE